MKNKFTWLVSTLVLTLGMATTTNAALIDRGNDMIYDDDLNVTWMADANYAQTSGYDADGLMSWSESSRWAENLVFGGYDDWRLFNAVPDSVCGNSFGGRAPFEFDVENCKSNNELGHLFFGELGVPVISSGDPDLGLFSNIQSGYYWSATEWALNSTSGQFGWEADPWGRSRDGDRFYSGDGMWVGDPYYGGPPAPEVFIYREKNEFYAWALRSGDVTAVAVPESASLLLLVAGLAGIAGIAGVKRRRC